jgi:CRP-like cAMP-binding protein
MLAKDWLPAAARAAAIDRKLKAGEALFRLDDKTIGLFEVIAGRVRLARVDRSGHEVVLHVAGAGETLAEASLFSPHYHCDAIASTNATVCVYPKREVLAACEPAQVLCDGRERKLVLRTTWKADIATSPRDVRYSPEGGHWSAPSAAILALQV